MLPFPGPSLLLILTSLYFLSYLLKEKKGSSFRDGNRLSGRHQVEDVPALTKSYSSSSGQDDHISAAQRKVHRNRCSMLFFAALLRDCKQERHQAGKAAHWLRPAQYLMRDSAEHETRALRALSEVVFEPWSFMSGAHPAFGRHMLMLLPLMAQTTHGFGR